MASNNILNTLHFERIARLNNRGTEQKPQQEARQEEQKPQQEQFSCAVCYTNGDTSGIVIPACCSHKICLACYTNIVLEHKDRAKCPECRTTYKKDVAIDEYADMPALISQLEYNDYYRFQNNIRTIHHIQLPLDNLVAISRLDNLIQRVFEYV